MRHGHSLNRDQGSSQEVGTTPNCCPRLPRGSGGLGEGVAGQRQLPDLDRRRELGGGRIGQPVGVEPVVPKAPLQAAGSESDCKESAVHDVQTAEGGRVHEEGDNPSAALESLEERAPRGGDGVARRVSEEVQILGGSVDELARKQSGAAATTYPSEALRRKKMRATWIWKRLSSTSSSIRPLPRPPRRSRQRSTSADLRRQHEVIPQVHQQRLASIWRWRRGSSASRAGGRQFAVARSWWHRAGSAISDRARTQTAGHAHRTALETRAGHRGWPVLSAAPYDLVSWHGRTSLPE